VNGGAFDTHAPAALQSPMYAPRGRGWCVFVDALVVWTRIGLHAHEMHAPQPVVLDLRFSYRSDPAERDDALLDYEQVCDRIAAFCAQKPHTRLLETLAMELAALSFDAWRALDALTLSLHKPKIRDGTQRVGVELDWTRADHEARRRVEAVVAAAPLR
jgi:dihydroneopterin aldolase